MSGPYRAPAPGAKSCDSFPAPPPPEEPEPWFFPRTAKEPAVPEIEDAPMPPQFTTEPLTESEVEFWKAVYVASIPKNDGPGRAEAADKAVLRLRKRASAGRKP